MNKKAIFFIVLALFSSIIGCGDDTHEVSHNVDFVQPSPDRGIWTENEGIGANRFDYLQSQGHILLPQNQVFVIEDTSPAHVYFVKIKQFLPKVTLEVAIDGGAPKTITGNHGYKDENAAIDCIDFTLGGPIPEDKCLQGGQDYDLKIVPYQQPFMDLVDFVQADPTFLLTYKPGRKIYAVNGEVNSKKAIEITDIQQNWKSLAVEQKNVYNKDLNNQSRAASAKDGFVQVLLAPYKNAKTNPYGWKAIAWNYTHTTTNKSINYICANTTNQYSIKENSKVFLNAGTIQKLDISNIQNDKIYAISLCGDISTNTGAATYKEVTFDSYGLPPINPAAIAFSNDVYYHKPILDEYTFYIRVKSNGDFDFIVSPTSSSWAWGQKENVKDINSSKIKEISLYNGFLTINRG